jgi:hypothetical protein
MEAAFKTVFREEDAVEIVLPDLLEAFAGGVAAMLDGTITDDLLRDRISRRAASYFRFVTPADLEPGDPGDAA